MPDVFLSYNREDGATAQTFAQALEGAGLSVWWDTALRSGEAYDEVTEEALRSAKAVVVLWSKRSVVSRWVRAEATLADRQKTLVPAMIEPCERPIMFELTQTADLSRWSGDTADRGWRAFLGDVRRMTDADKPAVAAPSTAEPASTQPPSSRRGEAPAIAILPFTNRSGEEDDDVFAEGMVEDVVAALSLSGGLKVLASSATSAFRRGAGDLTAVGRQLGARYILEGNVRRVGQALRVTSQLVEAETSNILWTQKFDRPLAELAALQEDLVCEVAAHLGVQVQQQEMERALRKPGDLTAWEAVVRSTAAWRKIGLRAASTAVGEARKAVELAPDFGLGRAALGHALATLSIWSGGDGAIAEEAIRNVERALLLDPGNPGVLWRAGRGYWAAGRPTEARRILEKAVRLNPNVADAHHSLGMTYTTLGMSDEAIAQFDAGDALAPHSFTEYLYLNHRAYAHLAADRHAQARDAVDRSLELNPNYVGALMVKAALCALTGETGEAYETAQLHRRIAPDETIELMRQRSFRITTPKVMSALMEAYAPVWAMTAPEIAPA